MQLESVNAMYQAHIGLRLQTIQYEDILQADILESTSSMNFKSPSITRSGIIQTCIGEITEQVP